MTKNFSDINTVFLVCAGRAGSGFLQSMLDSHPEILMLPMELKFLDHWNRYCEGKNLDLDEILKIWTKKSKISSFKDGILYGIDSNEKFSNCNIEIYTKNLREILRRVGLSKKNVFYALHEAYAKSIDQDLNLIKIIVEFSARSIEINQIIKSFPNAKFIEVVRDPRANYISSKNLILHSNKNLVLTNQNKFTNLLIRILKDLNTDYENMQKNLYSRNKNRWLIIRHEEMHLNNIKTIKKLINWLQISFHPSLNESTLGGHQWKGNSSSGKSVLGVSRDLVNRWRSDITSTEKNLIEFLFFNSFDYYSYNLEKPINKLTLKILLTPIKGEFTLKTYKQIPTNRILKFFWKIHPRLVFIIRFILINLLVSFIFYVQSRIWILNHLQKYKIK